jgi:hypothetical protein
MGRDGSGWATQPTHGIRDRGWRPPVGRPGAGSIRFFGVGRTDLDPPGERNRRRSVGPEPPRPVSGSGLNRTGARSPGAAGPGAGSRRRHAPQCRHRAAARPALAIGRCRGRFGVADQEGMGQPSPGGSPSRPTHPEAIRLLSETRRRPHRGRDPRPPRGERSVADRAARADRSPSRKRRPSSRSKFSPSRRRRTGFSSVSRAVTSGNRAG